MVHIVQFSEERIGLQEELYNHPDLQLLLNNHPQDHFNTLLAEIALYVNYAVDGDFYPEEIDKLCDTLTHKLRDKRRAIITTSRGLKL